MNIQDVDYWGPLTNTQWQQVLQRIIDETHDHRYDYWPDRFDAIQQLFDQGIELSVSNQEKTLWITRQQKCSDLAGLLELFTDHPAADTLVGVSTDSIVWIDGDTGNYPSGSLVIYGRRKGTETDGPRVQIPYKWNYNYECGSGVETEYGTLKGHNQVAHLHGLSGYGYEEKTYEPGKIFEAPAFRKKLNTSHDLVEQVQADHSPVKRLSLYPNWMELYDRHSGGDGINNSRFFDMTRALKRSVETVPASEVEKQAVALSIMVDWVDDYDYAPSVSVEHEFARAWSLPLLDADTSFTEGSEPPLNNTKYRFAVAGLLLEGEMTMIKGYSQDGKSTVSMYVLAQTDRPVVVISDELNQQFVYDTLRWYGHKHDVAVYDNNDLEDAWGPDVLLWYRKLVDKYPGCVIYHETVYDDINISLPTIKRYADLTEWMANQSRIKKLAWLIRQFCRETTTPVFLNYQTRQGSDEIVGMKEVQRKCRVRLHAYRNREGEYLVRVGGGAVVETLYKPTGRIATLNNMPQFMVTDLEPAQEDQEWETWVEQHIPTDGLSKQDAITRFQFTRWCKNKGSSDAARERAWSALKILGSQTGTLQTTWNGQHVWIEPNVGRGDKSDKSENRSEIW